MNRKSFNGKIFIANSFEKTQKLGKDFAKFLEGGDVVCLYGDLGYGKTTFVQGLTKGLGINKRIISPTFVIVRNYKMIKNKELRINDFYHIDLYRAEREKDIEGLGVEEIMNNRNNITVIEWAEKMGKILPKNRIDVKFEYVDENKRRVTIKKI